MRKRWTGFITAFVILAGTLFFAGCGEKAEKNKEGYVTRGQWIVMLAETFGMDTYGSDTPYYVDIDAGSDLFVPVQAAREWKVLSVWQTKKLEPDRLVTGEEAAGMAAIAAGFSVHDDQFDRKGNYDSTAAVSYAIAQGILKPDKDLTENMTLEECEAALAAAQYLYLNQPVKEEIRAAVREDLVDFGEMPPDSIGIDGNIVTLSGGVAKVAPDEHGGLQAAVQMGNEEVTLEAGSVFVTAPTAEYPFGIAYKVLSVQEADGEVRITTQPPSLAELYDELVVHATVSANPENIIWAEGVSAASAFRGENALHAEGSFAPTRYPAGMLSSRNTASRLSGTEWQDNSGYSYDFEFSSGAYEKTWSSRNSAVIGDGAGAQALEDSNFVYYNTPDIEDFNGSSDSWTRNLDMENKFSAGYKITGNLTIHALTVTTDVEYYKVDALLWEIETSIPESAALQVSSDISASLKLEGNLNERLKIATVPIPIAATGLTVSVDLYLYVDASGVLQVEASLGSVAKVEWEALAKLRHSVAAEAQSEVQMAVDIDFGAELAASLNAFGAVKIMDAGVKAGGSLEAEAGIIGSCEAVTEEGVTTQTYTESMYITSKLYVPIVSLYVGGEDSLIAKAGISGSWDIMGKDKGAHCITLIEEKWVIWTLQNVIGENGEQVDSSTPTAKPDTQSILAAMQNGDFSYFAGTYTPYPCEPFTDYYNEAPMTDITLNTDGTITGEYSYGWYEDGELESFSIPFAGTPPVSVALDENGAFICKLADGWEGGPSDGRGDGIWYYICPVGVSSNGPADGSAGVSGVGYDDLTGTDAIRLRYMDTNGGVLDIMFYKTE